MQTTNLAVLGIVHDFNNLLTAILGAAKDIAGRTEHGETRHDAQQIHAAATRGAMLVRELLDGHGADHPIGLFDVNAQLRDMAGTLRRLLGPAVKLVLALAPSAGFIRAGPALLDRVVINLAVNAGHAMPAGGVLTVRTADVTRVRPWRCGERILPPGRYVAVILRDTGDGIAPQLLPTIFDPFVTGRAAGGGTGLGLANVRHLVQSAGGSVAVRSRLGRGTSMQVCLPRHDGAAGIPVATKLTPAVPTQTRGPILLVEDEAVVRSLAARALSRAGWRVMAAESGEQALAMIRNRPEDAPGLAALVTDIGLPDMNGACLVAGLRALIGRPDLPAVLVSGYLENQQRQRLAAEHIGFLAKPYTLAELSQAVNAAVHGRS